MERYAVTLKDSKYNYKFITILMCYNIEYDYLNCGIEGKYIILIYPCCANFIKSLPYVNTFEKYTPITDNQDIASG